MASEDGFFEISKCGEIFRNETSGQYSFVCLHCGFEEEQVESLPTLIIEHFENHFQSVFKQLDTDEIFTKEIDEFKYDDTLDISITATEAKECLEDDSKRNSWLLDNVTPLPIMEIEYLEEDYSTMLFEEQLKSDIKPIDENPSLIPLLPVVAINNVKRESQYVSILPKPNEMTMPKPISTITPSMFIKNTLSSTTVVNNTATSPKPKPPNSSSNTSKNEEKITSYTCETCDRKFDTKKKFADHHRYHPLKSKKVYNCSWCKLKFIRKEYLERHLFRDHINKSSETLECNVCFRSYETPKQLREHRRHHLKVKPVLLQCTFCSSKFKTKKELNVHNVILHNQKIEDDDDDDDKDLHEQITKINCNACDKMFSSHLQLYSHQSEKHPNENLICYKCSADFTEIDLLFQHIITTHAIQCAGCYKKFSTQDELVVHTNSQLINIENFACEHCEKKFRYKCEYYNANHYKLHSTLEPLKCLLCPHLPNFSTKSTLHSHLYYQHFCFKEDYKYKCDKCFEAFYDKPSLVMHVTKHTGIKPISCDLCEKTFYTQSFLRAHLKKVHGGAKEFQCYVCGREFYSLGFLNEHMKKHTKAKKFQCHICHSKFMNAETLKKHGDIHEIGIFCDICNREFRSKKSLRVHKLLHENEKRYKCRYCDLRFAQTPGRRSHEKSIHGSITMNLKH